MNLCKKACNFAFNGECRYHHGGNNYREIKAGDCALRQEEIDIMKREYDLKAKK